jgi:hypothetical protein
VVVIGLVGIVASYAAVVPFFSAGEDALLVGAGFLAMGVVMVADLRRRNRAVLVAKTDRDSIAG